MKQTSTSPKSKTDWARLKSKGKSATPTAEHREADIKRGVVRRGLQPLPSKASISLRVDQDVLAWFKAQGPGYQTRINTVLRACCVKMFDTILKIQLKLQVPLIKGSEDAYENFFSETSRG